MTSPRLRLAGLLAVVGGAVAAVTLAATSQTVHLPPPPPAAETVRLGAPDPNGAVIRGKFVDDPRGQIETLAAGDHLVAWTVRTPADRLRSSNADIDAELPLEFPKSSKVVIVDERGGKPLVIDLGQRYVRSVSFRHGAAGEPQLAVLACASKKNARCSGELFTFDDTAPATLVRRERGRDAERALTGRFEAGRRLTIGQRTRGACLPALAISATDGTATRQLPPVPTDGATSFYEKCTGLVSAELYGDYAFATVSGEDTKLGLNGNVVYALNVAADPKARWHHVATPYRYSDGSTGYALGPAVAGDALFYEELDTENSDATPYDLERTGLPTGKDYTQGNSITPAATTDSACAIAATLDAVYELDNPRCSALASFSSAPSAIRRLSGEGLGLEVPSDDG